MNLVEVRLRCGHDVLLEVLLLPWFQIVTNQVVMRPDGRVGKEL
jgi:hypothetical protein